MTEAQQAPSLLQSPAVQGADHALRRAALRAEQIARSTGTSLWVLRDGKVVDLLAQSPERAARSVPGASAA